MQKYTVELSGNVDIAVIRAALAQLSDMVTVKPVAKRARIAAGASGVASEYVGMADMEYRRYCDKDTDGAVYCPERERWYLPCVMDGVSVQKAVNKQAAGRNRAANGFTRRFPQINVSTNPADDLARYMAAFCNMNSHKPAAYTNGVTA